MKQQWLERYLDVARRERGAADALIGFNANIDVIFQLGDMELDWDDVEPQMREEVEGIEELKSVLKYCMERGLNREVELKKLEYPVGDGEERLGGQAGIMSNFLSGLGNGVIFYTPFLSEELASQINEKVLFPAMEGEFVLKNVRDAVNTDRTKRNLIFEYEREKTGRVIFSQTMKGFGPYFRKGIEDNLESIQKGVDRAIFSGFHDVEGNKEAKIRKAENQLEIIDKPVHLEYVHRHGVDDLVFEHIVPAVNSIGLDEDELRVIADRLDIGLEEGDLSMGEVFQVSKELIQRYGLERCHVHTYNFHLTVTGKDYEVEPEDIREGMLFGELSAIIAAGKGGYPSWEEYRDFDMEDKHIHRLDDLEQFQDFFDLEEFVEGGIAKIEGLNVVAIPTIIHEDPEKVVGLGDIISSGAFTGEIT